MNRLYAPSVLATLATGGLAFFASSRTWVSADLQAGGLPSDAVDVTGNQVQPLLGALALVIAAAAIAVLAAGRTVRRWVGILIALAAAAGLVITVTTDPSGSGALASAIQDSPAFTGDNAPADLARSWWPIAAAAAFAIAVALGGLIAVYGPSWPTMGSRYDAPAAERRSVSDNESDLWKALDAGEDPTL